MTDVRWSVVLAGLLGLGICLWAGSWRSDGSAVRVLASDQAALTVPDARNVSLPQAGDQRVSVVVELEGEPVAVRYAKAQAGDFQAAAVSQATKAHLAALESAQQQVLQALAAYDVDVLYRTQRVYNGIALRARTETLAELNTIPGVRAVHRLVPKRPTNSTSVPYIHAPEVWAGRHLFPATGAGMRLALVDTGIDYLHPVFGGPDRGYSSNDVTRVGDVAGYPGIKVIGGWDFAGDAYDADPESTQYRPVPSPDPDPMDCYGQGHGTHVAATAAGYGVTLEGTPYRGPYNDETDYELLRIGPGVAPDAEIYALKIFGCSGSSELVDAAIEWAVDPDQDGDFGDHVDVLNMSLGSSFGSPYDPSSVAAENAGRIGVIVVASAGNDGDTYFAVGSPSVANRAISVAAIAEPASATAESLGTAATGSELDVASIEMAGGAAYDTLSAFSARGPRREDAVLKPDLAAPGQAIFSARLGPGGQGYMASGTSAAAPHVAGAMLLLRQVYPALGASDGSTPTYWSADDLKALIMNTSLPGIRVSETLSQPVYGPGRIGAGRIDLARALQTQVIAYDGEDAGLVSLSFGAPAVVDTYLATRALRLANKGKTAVTLTVAYDDVTAMPGVRISIDAPMTVTVPALGFATVQVKFEADVAAMERTRDPTVAENQLLPRHWLSEQSGYVRLAPAPEDAGAVLHVPVYAAPYPAGQTYVASEGLDFGTSAGGSRNVIVDGKSLTRTIAPTGVASLTSFFMLHYRSVQAPLSSDRPEPAGLTRHADLKYVGVATGDLAASASGRTGPVDSLEETAIDPVLYFAIVTHAAWSTPNEVEFHVLLDVDQDGASDYRLKNSDQLQYLFDTLVSDAFVAELEDLRTGARTSQGYLNILSAANADTAPYHTNVMILPVPAAAIGLTGALGEFRYYVETYSAEGGAPELGQYVVRTPVLYYNFASPGLHVSNPALGAPLFFAGSDPGVSVDFSPAPYDRAGGIGLLVLHHHNLPDRRTQVIPVNFVWPTKSYLPRIQR